MKHLLSGASFIIICILLSLTTLAVAAPFEVALQSRTIESFKPGTDQKLFGKLEFVGGVEFTSSNQHVGALSGLAVSKDRSRIIAVTDTGYWFTSSIRRGAKGQPLALENGRMAPILDASGQPFEHKWNADAESIFVKGSEALISFERDNRVRRYPLDLKDFSSLPKPVKLNMDMQALRGNKGLETIAIAPTDSLLKGAMVIVSERSYAARGQIRAAILNGPLKGQFSVKRKGKFDITDGDFLPNGDLLLLERRFNLASGIGMRIRKFKAGKVKPGANLKGKSLIEADVNYQIDNMEGLSVTTDDGGNIFLSLISDDNHSLLQRNLYLEFRLVR